MADGRDIEIVRGREELLDATRPLWLALRDHHHSVAPQLGAVRDDEDTWTRRRAQYAAWLAEDERAFFLLARRGDEAMAYTFLRPVVQTSTTWDWTDAPTLDIETLSVAPGARGAGLGARLLALVREEVVREGYEELTVSAIAPNVDALRFYEREGFTPGFIHLRDTTHRP
jgi:GNAT superfamily N-acetyltransferase